MPGSVASGTHCELCFNSIAESIELRMRVLEKRNLSIEKLEGCRRRNFGSFFSTVGLICCVLYHRRYYFHGQVTGDIFLCRFLDTRHCLMDKSLDVLFLQLLGYKTLFDGQVTGDFVFAVTWIQDIV